LTIVCSGNLEEVDEVAAEQHGRRNTAEAWGREQGGGVGRGWRGGGEQGGGGVFVGERRRGSLEDE
jgi:hypothetical protein